jgi:FlaA1/EpsC-like NDP-sugar epimerase
MPSSSESENAHDISQPPESFSEEEDRFLWVRYPLILALQGLVIGVMYLFSYGLRFDFQIPDDVFSSFRTTAVPYIILQLLTLQLTGVVRGLWRYISLRDALLLARSVLLGSLTFYFLDVMTVGSQACPRSVHFLAMVFSVVGLVSLRVFVRLFREMLREPIEEGKRKRVLLVGAGDAGYQIAREIKEKRQIAMEIVGFLDDAHTKWGGRILGIPILGGTEKLEDEVRKQNVAEVLVTIPSAPGKTIRHILDVCKRAGIPARNLPGLSRVIDQRVHVTQFRPITLEDLLRRKPAQLDSEEISDFIRGHSILVTGAGGSIGSELCRQLAKWGPRKIVLLDCAETPLYEINYQMRRLSPACRVVPVLASIVDKHRLEEVFVKHEPEIIFHAAAYKHVPLLEENPGVGVRNNVLGTLNLAELAVKRGTKTFVMISTDKAVRPTSVMGCSKRVCELLLQANAQEQEQTRFVTVRFGNVLGSNGSVIPRFQEQIRQGGPITVTHPEVTRFFMLIPEASRLVIQAGALGRGNDIFILDMGESVRIVDLARDLITLSGLVESEDIEIQFTGLRPGEKLYEELLLDGEVVEERIHPSILQGKVQSVDREQILAGVQELLSTCLTGGRKNICQRLRTLVPEFGARKESDSSPPASKAEDGTVTTGTRSML